MSTWTPRAGSGVMNIRTKQRHIVRRLAFPGYESGTPTDNDRDIIGVWVDTEDGELYLANGQYRRESFLEFMRRPTGFGANSWAQIAFIAVILLFGVAVIIGTWTDHGWVALPVPVGVVVVLFLKSYHQYLGRTR